MVQDASWDNSATPPPRKAGLGTAGKVLIGCGAAALCLLLALGGTAWLVYNKVNTAMDRGWATMHRKLDELRTEGGARRLYRENPGLAQNYPTEAEFVKASGEWRDKLGDIPDHRPELREMFKGKAPGAVVIRSRESGGRKNVTVRLRMSTGATLVVELENDRLTDIQVDPEK